VKKNSNQFCQDILNLDIKRARALANLVMALSSYETAQSVTALSLSPVYHYQYSSIRDAIAELDIDQEDHESVCRKIQQFCLSRGMSKAARLGRFVLFQTDTTPLCKPHSQTLKDRTHVSIPNNVIRGNKPISIGYETSFINWSDASGKWSLPLHIKRVGVNQTACECAVEQLGQIFRDEHHRFKAKLMVNTADSSYGNASFLAPCDGYTNMVNVVRLRSGMKVYQRQERLNTRGANGIYGAKFYLTPQSQMKKYKRHPKTKKAYQVWQASIFEVPPDEHLSFRATAANGRRLVVELWRWNDMMIRSKDGHNMKDKPFDLLAVKIWDAQTHEPVFDRQMYLAICGRQKLKINTRMAYRAYRHRYDIEPYLHFIKQKFKLQKYQTPDVDHLDNWLLIIQMASWLLYTARDEVDYQPKKWQSYLKAEKQAVESKKLSIAQVYKAAQNLFLTFDPEPFIPIKSKKGKGRQKGQTQIQRTRYEVVKKTSKKSKSKQKIP